MRAKGMFESRHTISSPGETPEEEDQGGVLGNLCEAGSVKESESSGTQGQSQTEESRVSLKSFMERVFQEDGCDLGVFCSGFIRRKN